MLTKFIPQPTKWSIWNQHTRDGEGWALSVGDAPSLPTGSPPALSHLLLQHLLLLHPSFQSVSTALWNPCSSVRNSPLTLAWGWGTFLSLPVSFGAWLSPMYCPSHSTPPRLPGTGDRGSVSSLPLRDTISLLSSRKPLLLFSPHVTCLPTTIPKPPTGILVAHHLLFYPTAYHQLGHFKIHVDNTSSVLPPFIPSLPWLQIWLWNHLALPHLKYPPSSIPHSVHFSPFSQLPCGLASFPFQPRL